MDPSKTLPVDGDAQPAATRADQRLVHMKDWVPVKPMDSSSDPACWKWDYLSERPDRLTPSGQLQFLREWQDGYCAICNDRTTLVLDHCHSTGLVRGYLCGGCNIREGTSTDPTDVYARWRAAPVAALLGLRVVYSIAGKGKLAKPDPDHVGGPRFLPWHAPYFGSWPVETDREPYTQKEMVFRTIFVVKVSEGEAARIEAENEVRRLTWSAAAETRRWSAGDPTPILGPLIELQAAVFAAAQLGVDVARKPRVKLEQRCPTRRLLRSTRRDHPRPMGVMT